MKYSRSIVSFAVLTAFCAGTAMAQSESGAPSFADLSKDGKSIKRSDLPKDNDALKEMRAHFNEADTNHDGKVDKGEYDAYIAKGSQRPPQN